MEPREVWGSENSWRVCGIQLGVPGDPRPCALTSLLTGETCGFGHGNAGHRYCSIVPAQLAGGSAPANAESGRNGRSADRQDRLHLMYKETRERAKEVT